MAKKKDDFDDFLSGLFQQPQKSQKSWTRADFKKLFSTKKNPDGMSQTDRMMIIASAIFIQNGVTPKDYEELYKEAENNPVVNYLPLNMLFNQSEQFQSDDFDNNGDLDDDFEPEGLKTFPLPGAENKSLILKIQLRGITKPPLWREVRIPANLNFEQLHDVIQTLFGWEHAHMWQFEKSPYSHGYRIGMRLDDIGLNDGPTDIASETPVTKVLKKPKDKMVYVYDFGDDWIHDISVKEVLDEKTDHPVCLKWKTDNPIEDIGGIWGLEEFRKMADPAAKHTKKEIKEFLDDHWFDSMDDFKQFMASRQFNLDEVNADLQSI